MPQNGRDGRPGQDAPAPQTEPTTTAPGQDSAAHRRPRSFTLADPSRPRVAVYRRDEPNNVGIRAAYWPVAGVLIEDVLDLFENPVRTRTVWAVETGLDGEIRAAVDLAGGPAGLVFIGVYLIGNHPRYDDPLFEVGS